jgi:hypothetical protein
MARAHQVIALVAATLCGTFASACPADIVAELRTMARGLALRSLHLAQALAGALDLLDAAGIPAIPYKGPVLSVMAYGDPGLRVYGDLDVWVHPWDYRFSVPELLARNGWSQVADYSWEKSFRKAGTAAVLDVHQSLTHRRSLPFSLRFEDALRESVVLEVAGRRMRTLDPARTLVVLCVQLAKDAGEPNPLPMIKVCDIAELLGSQPALEWSSALRIARHRGVLHVLGLGLSAAESLLGAQLPADARRLADDVPDRDRLIRHVEQRLFGGADPPQGHPEFEDPVAWNAAIRERFRDRNRVAIALLQDVLVPNEPEYRLVRLPKRLFAAYRCIRPVRLAWKYLGIAFGMRVREKPRS